MRRNDSVLACATLLALCPAAAPAGPVPPFRDAAATRQVQGDEQRVWSQGQEVSRIIVQGGLVDPDPQTTAYVQHVADRLFPEFAGSVKLSVLKSPDLNAFALPNGDIYINQGLLARFQNEAQLATVLAHEGTHFTNRHGYQSEQSVKNNAAFAAIGSIFGVPILPQLLAVSSIFGFSRELETEADVQGYARLSRAGYDVHESPKVFEHLMADIKAQDIKEPFFFADHPKLADRVANMRKLSAGAPAGGDGADRADYARVMQHTRLENLATMLSMRREKSALIMLQDTTYLSELPPTARYYLGEAYRLRDAPGDAKLAEEAYLKAVEDAPEFAPSYRSLGVLYLKSGQYAAAQRNLERYLELAPEAPDRKYAESYLRLAKQKGGQP